MATRDPKGAKDREGTRRWFAIGLATVFMFMSYTMLIFGFAAASEDEIGFGGGLIGIAFGLVPGVFGITAGVSNHEHSIRATLVATALWVVVGLPIAIFDLPTGLVAGFGAGGIVAFHRSPRHSLRYRMVAVVICVAYTFIVQRISPAAGLMVGSVSPLFAIAGADALREREVEASAAVAD